MSIMPASSKNTEDSIQTLPQCYTEMSQYNSSSYSVVGVFTAVYLTIKQDIYIMCAATNVNMLKVLHVPLNP